MPVIPNMKNYFLRSLITEEVCHYLSGNMGEGGIMKKVTNCDIGGRVSKIWHLAVTSFLNGSKPKYYKHY